MYSLEINNLDDIIKILKLNAVDFVDINFKKKAFIISNSSEIFGAIALDYTVHQETTGVATDQNDNKEDDLIIRVPRAVLLSILDIGRLEFDIQGENTIMTAYNSDNRKTVSATFKTQYANDLRYRDKMEIIATKHKILNVSEVQELLAIAKDFKSVVSVNNGVIGVRAGTRIRIYRETNIKDRFSIGLDVLKSVLALSNEVFLETKYLGATRGNVAILATQSVGFETDEYFILKEYGSGLIFNVDITNFVNHYRKLPISSDSVTLNTDLEEFQMQGENVGFKIAAKIENKRRAPKYNEVCISIPKTIVQNVMLRMHGKIEIRCKQTCTVLESNGLTVIY